jgi:Mce-associated membrane protein
MQCGFQSGDKDKATVLVVIGQTTTNVNIAAAGKPPSRVELVVVAGLEKDGDKWLVNKFDLPILKQLGNN